MKPIDLNAISYEMMQCKWAPASDTEWAEVVIPDQESWSRYVESETFFIAMFNQKPCPFIFYIFVVPF